MLERPGRPPGPPVQVDLAVEFHYGVEMNYPDYHPLDRDGRGLWWIAVGEKRHHTFRVDYESPDCPILICPRPSSGQPQDITSRPCWKEEGTFFQLRELLHQWLETQQASYQLEYRWVGSRVGWYVGFLDHRMATMFKLTWADNIQ